MADNKCPGCGVPMDKHGTACGWRNAAILMDENGIITDPEHPGFGLNFNNWLNPVPVVTNNQKQQ